MFRDLSRENKWSLVARNLLRSRFACILIPCALTKELSEWQIKESLLLGAVSYKICIWSSLLLCQYR